MANKIASIGYDIAISCNNLRMHMLEGILRIVGYSLGGIDTYFYEAIKDWKSIITKLI